MLLNNASYADHERAIDQACVTKPDRHADTELECLVNQSANHGDAKLMIRIDLGNNNDGK